ncbi:hypothetical protein [Kosakonia sacchari]
MAHGLWAATDFAPLSFQYSKNSALEKATLITPGRAYRHSEKEGSVCPVKFKSRDKPVTDQIHST